MSAPKFTPGPWIAAWDHGAISHADSICHIYPVDGAVKGLEISSVHLARPGTTEEANAHLIAAAPELFEAPIDSANSRLRYDPEFSRGYYASKNGQPRNLQAEGKDWHEGYDAFSVIAKATGERA